jgi:uncharacterized RDD family membrane protein YckC
MTDAWGLTGGDLVTGDAVVLELRVAKTASRGVAKVIDLAVQIACLFGLSIVLSQIAVNGAAADALGLCLTIAVIVGYPVLFETLTHGRSPGKLALGLRIVRDDGGEARFRAALARALVGVFEIWLTVGIVAVIASLISTRGKRLGDMVAGTVAVRERVPARMSAPMPMPPALAGWASTLELSRLPDDLALSARQFMGRAPELAPGVRVSLAYRLASDVARYIAPGPPPGCPPEIYLAAVLAERRRREYERSMPPAPISHGYFQHVPAHLPATSGGSQPGATQSDHSGAPPHELPNPEPPGFAAPR